MLTLTDFLLARIAEDEAAALGAVPFGTGEWETYTTGAWVTGVRQAATGNIICHARSRPTGANAHIARFDPARVLAECGAKRRIVDDFAALEADYKVARSPETEARRFQALVSVAQLALVYADHDDYDETWRP